MIAFTMAVLAPAFTLLLRWPLAEVLGDRVMYIPFFPAILVVAYVGGFWPGILATVLSALTATWFLVEPVHSFEITNIRDVVALGLLLLIGTMISILSELLHRARRRIVADERRRAAERLRKSEEHFRTFVDHATDAFFLQDEDYVVLDVNRQACDSLGYTREELLGLTPFDFDTVVTAADLEIITRRLAAGEIMAFESRHRRKDGIIFPVEVRGRSFQEGGRRFTLALVRDITERKRVEEALRESEERFRGTFENAVVGICHTDTAGHFLRVNEALCSIVDYPREELLQKTFHDITYPDDLKISEQPFTALMRGESTGFSLEKRYRRKDGSLVWVELFVSLQRDTTGKPAYAIAIVQDISKRKRLEVELRESEHRWRSLTEALPQLVWTALPDGSCDYFSTQWTQHTGVPAERLLGWQWMETLHPDDREPTRKSWTDSCAGRGPYDVEYRVRRVDGEYRWFKTRGVPIRDSEGHTFKWFGSCTDITDGKLAAAELHLARDAAESANRAKDEFLANVSHEIRTPMSAILGMTDLALGTQLTDDQRQCLRTVKSAADNLLGIINDLLDFSRIEAGKMELEPGDFSLRTTLTDAIRTLAIRAHNKGLELVSHVQPDLPDALIGDAGRLRQVLLNLVGNAVKFTAEGEVVVRVESAGDPTLAEVRVRFAVSDTGIGIAPEKQEKIFRAFEQEDTSTTRKYGGTGLGLTIAARLVALMGGAITVDSQTGRGSTFAFTALFGRQLNPPTLIPRPPVELGHLPVLIIDDNATNRLILEEWLRGWHMNPFAVSDGMAAMDTLWDAVSRGRPFSLVLLDARMPDTDGLVLAARIRKRPELAATRIILLTSGDLPSNLARLRELRIDAHLLKPAQQDELLETIYQVMSRVTSDEWRVTSQVTSDNEASLVTRHSSLVTPLRILVAEDNDFNSQLLQELLVRRGHQVCLANNGRRALSFVEEGGFDLLLLDVHMPELDGFQVIQAIRERERSAGGHLPVIALTARSRRVDRERCLAAGMDDFLTKPIQIADLAAAIDRVVVRKDEGGRMKDEKEKVSGSDSSFNLQPSSFGKSLVDARVLLAACGGDAVILDKICQAFRVRLPEQLTAVQEALRDGDLARLREAAHKICGMVAAFSTVAGNVASEIEDHAAQDQLEEARPLVARLETMAHELVRAVDGVALETLQECERDSR